MKRIYGLIFTVLLVCLILPVVLSSARRKAECLYILPQAKSYIYREDARLSFEIYSTRKDSIFSYPEQNTYRLVSDTSVYTLEAVCVEQFSQGDMTLLVITAALPPLSEESLYLEGSLRIENSAYTADLAFGSLSILKPDGYTLLGVDDYYASYAYIDGVLQLIGLNITFSKPVQTVSELKVGSAATADLSLAQKNMKCPNEADILQIIPDYRIEAKAEEAPLTAESRTYFFPVVYTELLVIRQGFVTALLDGIRYYIDTFSFIVNEPEYSEYKPVLKRGEIENAGI